MTKYSIGDWFYDNSIRNNGFFWKIKENTRRNGHIAYDVMFMRDNGQLQFSYWGDLSSVFEDDLRPVIDSNDLLRCKISDVQTEYLKAQKIADKLRTDIEVLLRAKEILEE